MSDNTLCTVATSFMTWCNIIPMIEFNHSKLQFLMRFFFHLSSLCIFVLNIFYFFYIFHIFCIFCYQASTFPAISNSGGILDPQDSRTFQVNSSRQQHSARGSGTFDTGIKKVFIPIYRYNDILRWTVFSCFLSYHSPRMDGQHSLNTDLGP